MPVYIIREGDSDRVKTRRLSPTNQSWTSMLTRVTNANRRGAHRYVGRGIDMDPRWRSFAAFLADMGERPAGTTLERADNDRGYWPDNCRWATPLEQSHNSIKPVWVLLDGERLPYTVAAARLGRKHCSPNYYLRNGYRDHQAIIDYWVSKDAVWNARTQVPNAKFTPEHDAAITRMRAEGFTLAAISQHLGLKSRGSVRARIRRVAASHTVAI